MKESGALTNLGMTKGQQYSLTMQPTCKKLTLTSKETAEKLGVSMPIIYALLRSEGFPTIRFGRTILVSRAGLEKRLAERIEDYRC